MFRTRYPFVFLAAFAWVSGIAAPSVSTAPKTWVVDDDGGPGVQFTDIGPAVAAASDGDLILILAGDYTAFSVAKELTLIGESGAVSVSGRASVQAAPGTVSLASMRVEGLDLIGCTQTVILDEVTISDELKPYTPAAMTYVAVVEDCSDVRFVECSIAGRAGWQHHALRVKDSRVELVTSSISGAPGKANWLCGGGTGEGGAGGDGIRVEGNSRVHASRSDLAGGDGGTATCGTYNFGGSAGSAAAVDPPSAIVVTGGSFTGGNGGSAIHGCTDGGDGIHGAGQLRRSGAEWIRGLKGFAYSGSTCQNGVAVNLPSAIASPGDPTLKRLGTPVAGFFGGPLKLRVHGDPGAKTRLLLGTQPQVGPLNPTTSIERLVLPLVTIDLGKMPSKGFITYTLPLGGPDLPLSPLFGERLILAQASCAYPGGQLRRTNSVPLVLR